MRHITRKRMITTEPEAKAVKGNLKAFPDFPITIERTMKPVEIEFIMRDKLSPGIDKAGKSAETLGDKAEQVSKNITDRIAAQKSRSSMLNPVSRI